MKKIITVALILTMAGMLVLAADAGMTRLPSNTKVFTSKVTAPATASAASVATAAAFYGLIFQTDGTNNITVNVYDNATAGSGTKLVPTNTIIKGSEQSWALSIDPPIACTNGIYVNIAVAGSGSASYQVLYDD